MGDFIAVTAFRTQSVESVARAAIEYIRGFQVSAEFVPSIEPLDLRNDAHIYQPPGDWIVTWWPYYFNVHDFPLARVMAAENNWLISTVHVYDGDYWEHLCCSGPTELHAFCSSPTYWQNDSAEDYGRILKYDSTPTRLAEVFGIAPSTIQPYLVDVEALPDKEAKAHPDDEHSLANYWVFIDFWRRLGIPYPESKDLRGAMRFGPDLMKKLPAA
jgi:hypothetical protein